MTSRAVDTPTPPDPADDPRIESLYYTSPNARQDAYNRGVMDAARALATPDPSIPERLDPEEWSRRSAAAMREAAERMNAAALGSIPERPAEPVRAALERLVNVVEANAELVGDISIYSELNVAAEEARAALQGTPETRDE